MQSIGACKPRLDLGCAEVEKDCGYRRRGPWRLLCPFGVRSCKLEQSVFQIFSEVFYLPYSPQSCSLSHLFQVFKLLQQLIWCPGGSWDL